MTSTELPEGFTIERHQTRSAYGRNGNAANATVYYGYTLHLDGKRVDASSTRGDLVRAANEYGRKGYSA